MTRTTLAIAIMLVAVTNASALIIYEYECGAARSVPAENNDKNPVIKTKIMTQFTAGSDRFVEFKVDHYAANGEVFKRAEQYQDIKRQSTKNHELWSGVSIANPSLTMVGTLFEANVKGQKRSYYVERQYRGGKLTVKTTSVCRGIEPEDDKT